MRIMGIDPGSLKTGFGVLDTVGHRFQYVASGVIRIPASKTLPQRLAVIAEGVDELIHTYSPDCVAIEDVFFARNPKSALKLGQARGAAITVAVMRDIVVSEYATRLVKQAVVGTGAATKAQVQFMVANILRLGETPQEDAADALAVAICHANLGDFKQ